jgi:Cu2+-exporting ATPase
MCCAGCKAVAEAIAGAGLSVFYDRREAPAIRRAPGEGADGLAAYDAPAFQKGTHAHPDGTREISLLVGGITRALRLAH